MKAIWAFFGIMVSALLTLVTLGAYRSGKNKVELEVTNETLKQIEKAKRARAELESDPEFAKRVRERFQR